MTRHQRRRAAKAKAQAKARRELVRSNLSTPAIRERTEGLISSVYANRMDRARGTGTTPGNLRPGKRHFRVVSIRPGPCSWNPNA
jgi:hypothetical protein